MPTIVPRPGSAGFVDAAGRGVVLAFAGGCTAKAGVRNRRPPDRLAAGVAMLDAVRGTRRMPGLSYREPLMDVSAADEIGETPIDPIRTAIVAAIHPAVGR